jgi:circadian clock protein KaiB
MERYLFKLYVAGQTPRSERAIVNLRRICDSMLSSQYELHVIDVLERPNIAEQEGILATPTVIRQAPLPPLRILGDLSDTQRVLHALGVPLPAVPLSDQGGEQ